MGRIVTSVTLENANDSSAPPMRVKALVDTGSTYMALPMAWKERFGEFLNERESEVQTATQEVEKTVLCGPVWVTVDGFDKAMVEVAFVRMEPDEDGGYEPLLGYTVLELCKAAIDLKRDRLLPVKYLDFKRAGARAEG